MKGRTNKGTKEWTIKQIKERSNEQINDLKKN